MADYRLLCDNSFLSGGRSSNRRLFQPLQHVVGGIRLTHLRKNLLDAMAVRLGVAVRHCVDYSDNVVAKVVGPTHRRFPTAPCTHSDHEHLRYLAATPYCTPFRTTE